MGARWAAALTTVFIGTLVCTGLWSPLATVRSVTVSAPPLPEDAERRCIEDRADLPPGVSLALLDTQAYAREIERLPWVSSARVQRSLWGQVRVEVRVRRPVARLLCGGRRWEMDEEGVVIRPARRGVSLPEIALMDPVRIERGCRVDVEVVLGGLAASVLGRAVPGLEPVGIAVDQINGICFNNGDRVAVCLGQADELPYKMALIRRIYQQEPAIAGKLEAIDLSCPQAPACTRRASARVAPSSEAIAADAG